MQSVPDLYLRALKNRDRKRTKLVRRKQENGEDSDNTKPELASKFCLDNVNICSALVSARAATKRRTKVGVISPTKERVMSHQDAHTVTWKNASSYDA